MDSKKWLLAKDTARRPSGRSARGYPLRPRWRAPAPFPGLPPGSAAGAQPPPSRGRPQGTAGPPGEGRAGSRGKERSPRGGPGRGVGSAPRNPRWRAAGSARSIPPSPARGGGGGGAATPRFLRLRPGAGGAGGGERPLRSCRPHFRGAQRAGRALDAPAGAGGRQPSGTPRSGAMSAGSGAAAGTATSALCLLLSLTAVAVCLLLGAKTAELQGRLAALEERGPGPLLDALQPRVEQLFREKLGEGLAKLRTAREAPSDCMCPPGRCKHTSTASTRLPKSCLLTGSMH
ncbi:pro-resilin-like [Neopsephotus bourkii]|uniref:pro-resilin-like n=1 Tax=Neopsephotus bourkii TaxID=309878 RepID=UPI002AA56B33|nr:pro-resilin-like [Neopsephotus bourkii]